MKTTRGIALLRPDPFTGLALTGSTVVLLFILLPLVQMILQPTAADMADTFKDGDVIHAIGLSMTTALCAGLIALALGTPFAYLLARFDFPGKKTAKLDQLVDALGIGHLLHRYVTTLSGGEKQRVALARALIVEPALLLLDEPLSALDPNFREEIRDILKDLTGVTVLMVTHDFAEARFLAQRIAVINNGCIEQIGTVDAIFLKPATPFTAHFVGMHNLYEATFENRRVVIDGHRFELKDKADADHRFLAFRPEDVQLHRTGEFNGQPNALAGKVCRIAHQGVLGEVMVRTPGMSYRAVLTAAEIFKNQLSIGDNVVGTIPPEALHTL